MCYDTVHYMQYISIFNHPVTMHKRICIVLFYGIQNQHLSLGNGFYVLCILYFFVFHLSNKKPTCAANARRTGKRASNPLYVPYHVFEYSAIFGDKNIAFSRCSHSLFTGF